MSRRASSPRHSTRPSWATSPERATLLALYAEADGLVAGWTCRCSTAAPPALAGQASPEPQAHCCHFSVTGREPYPTAVELEEIRHAMRAGGVTARPARALPIADARPCPLLSDTGRCRIYASRPLGCRTFFCEGAEAPFGARTRLPREALNAIGRRIADLSARFDPRDPHPRPIVRALRPDDSENRRF
jgi:hypothetical protein